MIKNIIPILILFFITKTLCFPSSPREISYNFTNIIIQSEKNFQTNYSAPTVGKISNLYFTSVVIGLVNNNPQGPLISNYSWIMNCYNNSNLVENNIGLCMNNCSNYQTYNISWVNYCELIFTNNNIFPIIFNLTLNINYEGNIIPSVHSQNIMSIWAIIGMIIAAILIISAGIVGLYFLIKHNHNTGFIYT